jgi:hypothetical protein
MIGVPLRRIVLSIPVILMTTLLGWAAKATVDRFDGPWSVVIVTDSGTCDRAYRYGLRIEAGQVRYEGGADVTVSGTVDPRGRVTVDVRSGGSTAHGSGHLDESTGSGNWQGASANSRCAGTWEAERPERPAR